MKHASKDIESLEFCHYLSPSKALSEDSSHSSAHLRASPLWRARSPVRVEARFEELYTTHILSGEKLVLTVPQFSFIFKQISLKLLYENAPLSAAYVIT